MKIDLVITELFPGGAEKCLAELAVGFAESGDRVRVCSIGNLPVGPKRLLVDRIEASGVEVHSCEADHPAQFLRAYRDLKNWLCEGKSDVCQTFLFHANVLGTAASRNVGKAIRVGGLRVAEANPVRGAIERWAVRRMDSLVCVSAAVQTFAAEYLHCEADHCVTIPNAVDVSRMMNAKPISWTNLGWAADAEVIAFVGRMHSQKGIDVLQKHVDRLVPKGSTRRLLLVGEGPLQNQVDEWIRTASDDRVKRLPWQSDIGPLIRSAQLLLLPSRYEGMPNVVMEAMAAARPVVCSRVEGIQELLPTQESGPGGQTLGDAQTYVPGDVDRMLELVDSFFANSQLAERIGGLNQVHVRNHFSIPAMIDAYRSHYRFLLAEREDER